jgi:lauroyl/myristoyl acyltransferase
MKSAVKKVVSAFQLGIGWGSFYFVRFCERTLPVPLLSLLLWPLAAAWDLMQVGQRRPWVYWHRFPRSWRPKRWRYILRHSLGLYHSQLFYMWPDRLSSPRWMGRCRFEGDRRLLELSDDDRGIVLAGVHFGPFEILPYWLRAYGIPATSVRADPPAALQSLTNYQYSLSPPPEIPVFVFTRELSPFPRLHLQKILGPGRRLLVMVDPNRGLMTDISFEDRLFHMATGAIRLAQMTGSRLIPCMITEDSTWKFTIHIGTPVPQEWLGNSLDMQLIGTHLLGEFSKVVTRFPVQCKMRCLRAMWPLPESGVAESSEVPAQNSGQSSRMPASPTTEARM